VRDTLIVLAVLCSGACAASQPGLSPRAGSLEPAQVSDRGHRGSFIQASEGTALIFCSSPGLSVTLKVDSVSTGATRIAMGTAEISAGGSNAGTHRDVDEVNYFLDGQGRAFIGVDTVDVRPGLVMYVPQGVRHGFLNTGSGPLRFAWTIVPQGLAKSFRSRGVAHGTVCAPPGL
jgi:mannose-6-phosphate isomerase-like protein (cupin superfamily)